jgi:glucan biosynthesis protein C
VSEATSRRAEFDWLRLAALSLMMAYHSAIGFSSWPWHVSDTHRSVVLGGILAFVWSWRVALVFVVSGAALMLALRRHSPAAILRERMQRLAVPLIFGMLVIVPPQVYLERLQRGQFHGSYFDYLPHFADGIYPAGNLSWHHLWFIPYVLVLTAIALPLFMWARAQQRRQRLDLLMQYVADRHLYWLLVVPLALGQLALRLQTSDSHGFINDGHGWIGFGTLLALGGVLAEWPQALAAVQRQRYAGLVVGLASFGALKVLWPAIGDDLSTLPLSAAIAWCGLSALNVLAWVLTVTGFVTRWFSRGSPTLAYLTDAALPIYMLHQTLIVFAVYHLHHVYWPLGVKLLLTLNFSVLGSLALYEIFIRRWRWLRLLFGVKSRAREIGLEVLMAGSVKPGGANRSRASSS